MMIPGILEQLPKESLSLKEEQDIAKLLAKPKAAKQAKRVAHEMLVLHSMREAFFYARHCCRSSMPADEIYSLCYIALCKAADNFKTKQLRFFAYSKVFIRGEISREWKKKSIVKNIPGEQMEPLAAAHPPSEDDSLRVPKIVITDETQAAQPEFSSIHAKELWAVLAPLLEERLTPDEKMVILMRYKQELNFEEIGALLGTTKQWAQVLHAEALTKLRSAMERNKKEL